MKIAPSLLSADFTNLQEEIERVSSADYLHCDIMDGHFVPNITFGPFIVRQIKQISKIPLDVHLMIENPEHYVEEFIKAGADIVTVHAEATHHIERLLSEIRRLGAKAGVSYNPGTDVNNLPYFLHCVDLVLIMTVNPGFGGQKFIESQISKIEKVKNMIGNLPVEIQVDGGITHETAPLVKKAGANVLVAGSYVFGDSDPSAAVNRLRSA